MERDGLLSTLIFVLSKVYWGDFFTHLDGFQGVTVNELSIHILRDYVPDFKLFTSAVAKGGKTTLCSGKIKHVRSTFVESFECLKGLVLPEQVKNVKMAMGSPHWFHFRRVVRTLLTSTLVMLNTTTMSQQLIKRNWKHSMLQACGIFRSMI
ncbi:uncharacterized protein Z519_05295 [Cladophialophora bantiana CBS 173.52]|uniref:Uncharacterized protein n=1 Tax=Cladophialophora bantiana (strain ATCC 10958 / CBS 173.52 / CDC B-1940 / NIH 8579) TaxID=1442370 RepID=A0A0D2HT05_CLAB1|nr:uncharacterized protein Z519_05295 [Cladophialophora bantiana CBS 173.52]KIW93980.1 hypothetical protein Z519_05295 [Cladophialophora bantiana CBS 173.52]